MQINNIFNIQGKLLLTLVAMFSIANASGATTASSANCKTAPINCKFVSFTPGNPNPDWRCVIKLHGKSFSDTGENPEAAINKAQAKCIKNS